MQLGTFQIRQLPCQIFFSCISIFACYTKANFFLTRKKMPTFSNEQQELIDNIKKKLWHRAEEVWLQIMENPTEDAAFYEHIAATIARNGGAQRLPDLWEIPLTNFLKKGKHQLVLDIARFALKYVPDAPNLHPAVLQAFKEIHKNVPQLDYYIRASHLRDKFNLGNCLAQCEEYLYLNEGEFFQHINWGIGKVVELDLTQRKVVIDFPKMRNKTLTFEGAHQFLQKIPQDHFLALQETQLEKLKEMAENDPLELTKIILKSFEKRINLADLKALMTSKLMSEDAFSNWWNKLKTKLRNDPWIELSPGTRPDIRFRDKALDYFDEMLIRFDKGFTLSDKHKILKELETHQKGEPLPLEKAAPFVARVRMWHRDCSKDDLAGRLILVYLMDETSKFMPSPTVPLEDSEDSILNNISNPVEFMGRMDIANYEIRALERFIALRPEESANLLALLYLDAPPRVGQYAFEKLLEKKEFIVAADAVNTLLDHFDRNPQTYAWTVKQILKKKWPDVDLVHSDFTLLEESLNHLERVRQKYVASDPDAKENRHLQSLLRAIFTEDKFANIAAVLPELSSNEVKRFNNSIQTSPAFISTVKDSIDNLFRKIRKDVFEEDAVETGTKVHYCTTHSLKSKQEELRHIKSFEIPQVTNEIEIARGHGDLSENAEYHAAKDRQTLLFKQMEELQDLISRARIIDSDKVQTTYVGIGTRFTMRNIETNKSETHALLGMWETDPEKGIINYLSPMGQSIIGKKVGDKFELELPGGEKSNFEIISIENAFK